MSVRLRLVTLCAVTFSGFLILFITNLQEQRIVNRQLEVQSLMDEVYIDVLQMRRHEKNFFLRNDLYYVGIVKNYYDEINKKLGSVKAIVKNGDREYSDVKISLDKYWNSFKKASTRMHGNEGSESLYMQAANLSNIFLIVFNKYNLPDADEIIKSIHRHEVKFFIVAGDEERKILLTSIEENINKIDTNGDIDSNTLQELRQSFDKYYETINTIYELENLKKSILSDFVSAGRSMEPLVESLRKRHLSELERLGRRMDRVILGSVVFMMFVVLVTALRMMVTITRQLRAMQSYSHRVASGVLDAAPEGVFFGEFLKMENDIIAMVERLKENIYALRSEREKAIQQAQRAEAALKVKSDFLSAVSHELKTPLTSLLGFARLSEKKMKKWMAPLAGQDKEGRSHVDKLLANMRVMVEEGELLDKLIKNILDLIDLESEKTLWELAPFSLEEAADRAAAEHQDAARNKGLSLIVKSEPSLPKVLADEKWIERVLDNLISNAIKFSQHGAIECGLEKVDQGVMFTILDSGPGIPQDKLGEIFDRFTQIGDVNTGKPAGLGIGLAICREVIRGAGGRIWAESEPGQGGRFSFILPVAPGEKS